MRFDQGQFAALRNASMILRKIIDDIWERDNDFAIHSRFDQPPQHDGYVTTLQVVLDSLATIFRLVPKFEIHDHGGRNIAIDLAIPQELTRAFSFIGGRDDGTLFVLSPRASMLQIFVDGESPSDVTRQLVMPILVHANRLVRFELKEAV